MTDLRAARTGISVAKRRNDLADFDAVLDEAEGFGVETIELPTYDLDIVVGGRIRRPQLAALKAACHGRNIAFTAHGPLAINFMDEPFRLPRHLEVLKASVEVASEVGAVHYVVHSGLAPITQVDGLEAAYRRQSEWLFKAGEVAKNHNLILCVETMFGGFEGKVHASKPSRLASELRFINHPNVMATLDFSHSYLHLGYYGEGDFMAEVAALAPLARHLHIHDSFGRADDIWTYSRGEALAYGHGDLHLPVGWGSIPWDRVLAECVFPPGVVFNIELEPRYWYAAQECVEQTKAMAARAQVNQSEAD